MHSSTFNSTVYGTAVYCTVESTAIYMHTFFCEQDRDRIRFDLGPESDYFLITHFDLRFTVGPGAGSNCYRIGRGPRSDQTIVV